MSRGSHTQIKQDRDQIVNVIKTVLAQGITPEQEARTTKQSNITQIDEMEVEDIQATTWNWNIKGSKQNSQPKSYSEVVRRPSITGYK
ncbi:6232_t:CDS:1, partial [Gigaspora margarita]